jgi:hypothetical protein
MHMDFKGKARVTFLEDDDMWADANSRF